MILLPNGNLGIGINNPQYKLDVTGRFHLLGSAFIDSNLTLFKNLFIPSLAQNTFNLLKTDSTGKISAFTFSGNSNDVLLGNGTFSDISTISGWTINGNNIYTTLSGNVGVGTSNPQAKLHVIGDAIITNGLLTSNVIISDDIRSRSVRSDTSKTTISESKKVQTESIFASQTVKTDTLKAMGVTKTEVINVGSAVIGNEKLTVAGDAKISGKLRTGGLEVQGKVKFDSIKTNRIEIGDSSLVIDQLTTQTGPENHIYVDTNSQRKTLFLQSSIALRGKKGFNTVINGNNPGNVGIGTMNPQSTLHIRSTSCHICPAPKLTAEIRLQDDIVDQSGNLLNTKTWIIGASSQFFISPLHISPSRKPFFTILENGKFGIGTNSPSAKVHIVKNDSSNFDYLKIESKTKQIFYINKNGNVGIGMRTPQYKLDVCGTVRAKEIHVNVTGCDFVFDKNYKLPSIKEKRLFTYKNGHLMYIKPAFDMRENGAALGSFAMGLLQNVEEHELYLYNHEERINKLEKENEELKNEIKMLKKIINNEK